jgi:integrase
MTTGQKSSTYGEGSVFQDSDGRWRVSLYRNGRRRTAIAKTEREGHAKRVKMLAEADAGIAPPDGSETLGQAVDRWREAIVTRGLAPATMVQYLSSAQHITDGALGKVKLKNLRVEHIDRFLAELGEDYSRATVNHVRKALRQVLADAKRRRRVSSNLVEDALPATGQDSKSRRALSEDEISRFLAAAEGGRYEHLLTLALDTGARRGELLGLRWDRVDLEAATIRIDHQLGSKAGGGWELTSVLKTTNSYRSARISAAGVAALNAQKAKQAEWRLSGEDWNDLGLVFTAVGGLWIDPSNLARSFAQVLKRAGLDRDSLDGESVTMHWLRHTHGSHLVDNGVPPIVAADQLGESLETFLRTYRHHTRPIPEQVSEAMGALFARVRNEDSA